MYIKYKLARGYKMSTAVLHHQHRLHIFLQALTAGMHIAGSVHESWIYKARFADSESCIRSAIPASLCLRLRDKRC
jgi:hypothetical protein